MIPTENIILGEILTSKIFDIRGVAWSPFGLPENTPMINPISLQLHGEWEDGFHLKDNMLIEVKSNELISAFKIEKIK